MSKNDFSAGFLEYFYYYPCCRCKNKYEDCAKRGDMDSAAAMILNRLERIMVDDGCDCWEEKEHGEDAWD